MSGEKSIIDDLQKCNIKINNYRTINNAVAVELNATHLKVDKVPGLKTLLYPHQKTVVKGMLDSEYYRSFNASNYQVCYSADVLSEPVGSGKTVDILALICLQKIPRAVPDIMRFDLNNNSQVVGYIRRRFKKFLLPTIIFVGSSVMKQWERAIKTFTDFKSYSVNSVVELKSLFEMISSRTINRYDIVLVKNGKITVPIKLPDDIKLEPKNKVGQPFIYNLIANLSEYCWARVVIDDFDTIKLPHNAGIVPGIFTWFVSSTRKRMEYRSTHNIGYEKASEILTHHEYGCANIMYNNFLFGYLNIRNDINYLKATTSIPHPKFHIAVFKNPHDTYISMLTSLGDIQSTQIAEMLNGNAFSTAAEVANIKSTSVADIFGKILGDKYEQYRFSGDLLAFIDDQKESEDERKPMADNPDENDTYGKQHLLTFRDIEYKYPGVNKLLNDTELEYKEVQNQNGSAIQRVKDNIKHGKCPVCRGEFEDIGVIITKCCSAMFCENCGIVSQNIGANKNKITNGRCAKCRKQISIKDLIYIGHDIKLENIVDENFSSESESESEAESDTESKAKSKSKATSKATPPKKPDPRTKFNAIIDILRNNQVPEDKRVDMHIPNMMKGATYLPEAPIRKALVFANYDETLKSVVEELQKNKIKFWKLSGGISEIDKLSGYFTDCKTTCALVINSTTHCSGLNLQSATDLIFTHAMLDANVESQVVGRGHRLNRTNPLNVWYLTYENEYSSLCHSHNVRVLSDEELKDEKNFEIGKKVDVISTVKDNKDQCYLEESKDSKDFSNSAEDPAESDHKSEPDSESDHKSEPDSESDHKSEPDSDLN
jgi:hypothetical protein